MTLEYVKHFPYQSVRPEQDQSIKFALRSFDDKKFVILELGTGCGKSAIGLTVSRCLLESRTSQEDGFGLGSYILTTQKVLQEQYLNDFGPPHGELVSIKSSTNYQCEFHSSNTCAESSRMLQSAPKGGPFWNKCISDCAYKREKKRFLESSESITNYSYFLAETMYSGHITPRDLLVLDEAHNCENELSKFVEVVISEKFATEVLKLQFPAKKGDSDVIRWINDDYMPALDSHVAQAKRIIEKLNLNESLKEFQSISTQLEMLDKHRCKVERFLNMWSIDNWILNVLEPTTDKAMRKLEFKPVDVGPYANELLFSYGKKVLMMSATIVNRDVFCRSLGIDINDVAFLSLDSPFPIENRPIVYAPVGSMSMGLIDANLPKLVEAVKLILDQHKNEKGIIHAHTFRIANFIKKNIKGSRLIIHDSMNRDEMIEKHMSSKKPTVLISPSLAEGIDLKDDLSRFQIICKVPFPYLGDKLVKKRMAKNHLWYPFQTAKTVVQSAGRSVRNENDHAVTYILDSDWRNFFERNPEMFPESFRAAIR